VSYGGEKEAGMHRGNFAAVAMMLVGLPLGAQTSKPAHYLSKADHRCRATLADGTPYEAWNRVIATEWDGQPLYVKVRAYYKPGSGELLWRSTGLSEKAYRGDLQGTSPMVRDRCAEPYGHILVLQDGEWADFWAERGRVVVYHCDLKFKTRGEVWDYLKQHWRDGTDDANPSTKWGLEILLYDQLGAGFFRPKKLEFDARPYSYDSLVSVKKNGNTWELIIRGADEPSRAIVLLDHRFKIAKVAKDAAASP
jgi:hypothetical protein